MNSLRIWIILSWIALPTVMFGGCSLLNSSIVVTSSRRFR